MRLKTKIMLAAVPVIAVAAVGTALAMRAAIKKHRQKRAASFMPQEVRASLEELCSLKGEDFVPDKLGNSLYQRRLEKLTDRQLIGVYAAIKTAEVLRGRGVDLHNVSKADIAEDLISLRAMAHERKGRQELITKLGSVGAETALSMLNDGVKLMRMAEQAA